MEESKRWTVTYTKHVKQKRKVYQDGFLELLCSATGGDKVALYDDTGKVIDSMFLKKDQVVELNGMLTFDGHLVDIGDLEGNSKPLVESNAQQKDIKPIAKFGTFCRNKAGHILPFSGSKQNETGSNGAPVRQPSLIHNIKREYKDIRQKVSEAPKSQFSATQITEVLEWDALYTTQVTQKAKRYHDGIVRVELRGSHGKQVMLYDASRKLLDTRFLKKDEVVESGETVAFAGHVVDIGDRKSNNESVSHFDDQETDENKEIKQEDVGAEKKYLQSMQDTKGSCKEWHVLYTTQVTQKAKKYHDGILRLAVGVYHRKQAMLLNEDGTILSSKFLSSSEDVRTGCMFQLANYMVEVGEAHILQEGVVRNDDSSKKGMDSCSLRHKVDRTNFIGRGIIKNLTDDGPRTNASLGKDLDSYCSKVPFSSKDTGNKLIRDAHQILSTLRRPVTQESSSLASQPPHEPIFSSQSSDFRSRIDEKLLEAKVLGPKLPARNVIDIPDDNPGSLNPRSSTAVDNHRSEITRSKVARTLASTSSVVHNGNNIQPLNPSSNNTSLSLGSFCSVTPESAEWHPEKIMTTPSSSILAPQVSKTMTMFSPGDAQAVDMSVQNGERIYNVQIKEPPLSSNEEAGSSYGGCQMVSDVTDNNSDQACADNEGTDSRSKAGAPLALAGLNPSVSCCPINSEKENPKMLERAVQEQIDMCDFPNFDLGI